jgi:peptidoglycan hydrolase-like protein with peptidoglycan-binding domain
MDQMVLATQQWLNKTYGGVSGFGNVPEDGKTGWTTVYGLTRALQHELGITDLVDNFGPTTKQKFNNLASKIIAGYSGNIVYIIQGGFWCKGINPGAFDGKFTSETAAAVTAMKEDAGLAETDSSLNGDFMAALLNMSAFVLVANGDTRIREMQQQLNHDYLAYTGILPCDGIYQRDTNTALIYALQAEEKLSTSIANGAYGPTTKADTPTIKAGDQSNFVRILQWGLYVNNKVYTGAFDGNYSSAVVTAVADFEAAMALAATDGSSAGVDVFMSLLTSAGNTARSAIACDTSYQLTSTRVSVLKNAGYSIVGRYLTGTVGAGSSERAKNLTTAEIAAITAGGLKVFPIYQAGASDSESYFTTAQGNGDGTKAIAAANELGFPAGTVIYFAVDVDIQAGDIAGTAGEYFTGVATTLAGSGYNVGVYGTRNVCQMIIEAGSASKAFVSDMSTGYSGNLGFSIPTKWAFDQFAEISIGDFAIDKVATSSTRETATKDFNIANSEGNNDDLQKINNIIQELADNNGFFQFVKSVGVKAFGETYTVETPLVTLTLKVDVGSSISTNNSNLGVTYNVTNGDVSFTVDNPIKELLTENNAALGADQVVKKVQQAAGTIKNGSIITTENISTTGISLTLKLKSTFEHEDSNGDTYEMDYEITLTAIFHDLNGSLPVTITVPEYTQYENEKKKVVSEPKEILDYVTAHGEIALVVMVVMVCAPETTLGLGAATAVDILGSILS